MDLQVQLYRIRTDLGWPDCICTCIQLHNGIIPVSYLTDFRAGHTEMGEPSH